MRKNGLSQLARLWTWLVPLLLLSPLHAQESDKPDVLERISDAIDQAAEPVADGLSTFVFWGPDLPGVGQVPLVIFLLMVTGVFLTLWFGFINLRAFGLALRTVRGKYTRDNAPGEITHFQALSAALAATVGLGNIAGVSVAIGIGGPGATFWMVLMGFLGMTTKFTECTLGVRYRKIDQHGKCHGGAMYYLTRGFAEKGAGWAKFGAVLAVLFAIFTVGGAIGAGNLFQANQAYSAVSSTFGVLEGGNGGLIFGLGMATLVALVIIGGIKSIGKVTSVLVPFMCIAYVIACIVVLLAHFSSIPSAVGQILSGAFGPQAVVGGILGAMIQGIKRSTFSNEAGIGSAPIAHSAVKTDKPASEGLVALLEPFVDTVVVCTMTALVVVVTDQWKTDVEVEDGETARVVVVEMGELESADGELAEVTLEEGTPLRIIRTQETPEGKFGLVYADPDTVDLLGQSIAGLGQTQDPTLGDDGVSDHFALAGDGGSTPVEVWVPMTGNGVDVRMDVTKTREAFRGVIPWFPTVLAIAVFLFAFSTMLSWGYYGEQAVLYLAGGEYKPRLVLGYKLFFCIFTVLGCVLSIGKVIDISDSLFFLMVVPNLIGVYFLLPRVSESLREFVAHARAIDRGEKTRQEI